MRGLLPRTLIAGERSLLRSVSISCVIAAMLVAGWFLRGKLVSATPWRDANPSAAGELDPGSTASATEREGCDHVVPSALSVADARGAYASVRPGDIVCLQGGPRGPLRLENFEGTDGAPITFVDSAGSVHIRGTSTDYAGLQFRNSHHVRLTGSGDGEHCGALLPEDRQACGIAVTGSERGITGSVLTSHIEIDHVEVATTNRSGISIRDNSLSRDEWVERNITLRDSYLHDIGEEGAYIGSSSYESGDFHTLDGVTLSDNLVTRTGRDGLQVGSATRRCTITGNVVRLTGLTGEAEHGAGIMNNKGSVCDIADNVVVDTAGWGVYVQGNGANRIYNNVVVRTGTAREPGDGRGDGITIRTGSNTDRSIHVWNNTIVSARGNGIRFTNTVGSDNQVINNLVAESGAEAVAIDEDAAVRAVTNLAAEEVLDVRFQDPSAQDYRLLPESPAVDAGTDLSPYGLTADFAGVPRPRGAGFDVGAFELEQ